MKNIAASVREDKELHPENYCRVPRCLWRIKSRRGDSPCRNHPLPAEVPAAETLREMSHADR